MKLMKLPLTALVMAMGLLIGTRALAHEDSLRGTWSVITAVGPDEDGEVVKYSEDSISGWSVTFSTEEMTWTGSPALVQSAAGGRLRARCAVTSSTVGHGLNLTFENGANQGRTAQAIYRIRREGNDDVLTLRIPTNPSSNRPTNFESMGSKGNLTLRLKRSRQ